MQPIRLIVTLTLALAGYFVPAHAAGQDAEAQVRNAVDGLFEAMRTVDGARAAALFHPEARLLSVSESNGASFLSATPATEFVQAVGTPRTDLWDERISGLEIRVDGNMATAWMNYGFFLGGQFSHCGVNAFQLFEEPEGWRIIQVTDTRRREGCQPPP